MYRRKVRNTLPMRDTSQVPSNKEIHQMLSERQTKQKENHDRHGTRELRDLETGQRATMRDSRTGLWTPVVVKDVCAEPHSYIVQTPNGNTLRRNRTYLRDLRGTRKQVHFAPIPEAIPPRTTERLKTPSPLTVYRTRSGRPIKPPNRLIEEWLSYAEYK